MIVYANKGSDYDGENMVFIQKENEKKYKDYALDWYNQGVKIIGGCCEIGPSEIT